MEIKSIRMLGKAKNQIVVNEYYIFSLSLMKDIMYNGKKRVFLTAKKIGYTTDGARNEVFKKKQNKTRKRDFIFECLWIIIAIVSFIWAYKLTGDIWIGLYFGFLFGFISFMGFVVIILILDREKKNNTSGVLP